MTPAKVVHLHPSLRCNLRCAHCYSSSGPTNRTHLDIAHCLCSLEVLRREGFEVVSISGGEPLLYPELPALLRGADGLGLRVAVVTNGMLFTGEALGLLAEVGATVAVSIDGTRGLHDDLRGQVGAYDAAVRGLEMLADAGINHGVAMCVTQASLSAVVDVYELATRTYASSLQLQAVVATGRGRDAVGLNQADLRRVDLVARLLDQPDGPYVQCDLIDTDLLRHALAASLEQVEPGVAGIPLPEVINPLVIRADGGLEPFAAGVRTGIVDGPVTKPPTTEGHVAVDSCELRSLLGEALGMLQSEDELVDPYALLTLAARELRRGSVVSVGI